jgi:GGDEF domain-containing protein
MLVIRRLKRLLTTTDPGSVMVRRLIPLAVLVPLALGWLRLKGQEDGVLGLRAGTWLLTATEIVCLLAVIIWAASSLSRTDAHRRRLEDELHRLAGEDELTQLANRRGFSERLHHELALASRHGSPGALLMIDLDRFKAINDRHGHAAGDALLCRISEVLQGRLRDTDAVGRLGGDEFVAYLPQTSIGVAFDATSSHGPEVMLKAADRAMYRAKRAGGNRVDGYEPSPRRSNVPSPGSRRRAVSEAPAQAAAPLAKPTS